MCSCINIRNIGQLDQKVRGSSWGIRIQLSFIKVPHSRKKNMIEGILDGNNFWVTKPNEIDNVFENSG